MRRFSVATLFLLLTSTVPALAQQSITVSAQVGMTQPLLVGVLSNSPVTGTRVKGSTITGTTTTLLGANVPWALRVSLVAPVNPILSARFRLGNGRLVELTASQPTAIVTSGPTACARCAVTLDWTFEYRVSGKTKFTPTIPPMTMEALPVRGP